MAKLFGCLFLLLFGILLVVLLPFIHIGRYFFSTFQRKTPSRRSGTGAGAGPSYRGGASHHAADDGKIFHADEGEYVDFEEVKE